MSAGSAGVAPRVAFGSLADDYREKRAAIDAAIAGVLERGRFILGEEVARFEESFAKFLSVGHVVGCANGTEAIALALQAAGARADDEVLLPANTCVPTLAAVRLSGARPRLADVDPGTLTLDAENADRVRTAATKFLLPVHLYGGVADLEGLDALARSEGLILVEDCAQSHGASLAGRPTGGFGRAAAFSFYPSKNLGAYGDGGAVATNDAEIAARLRQLRQYGWDRRDHAEREGWNSRLDELQAAILTAKLPWLARENARRRQIAERYDAVFRELPLQLLAVRPGTLPARHLYPVFSDRRDALHEHLASHGIETGFHYPFPLHLQPAYAFLGHRKGDFPISEAACETELSLPIYPSLSDPQVETVVSAVGEFFGRRL
ncbi:MAG: DegT/DnrJ/EryC1/StrS family aminotransferase [Thermoanaerobaculia bacterium]